MALTTNNRLLGTQFPLHLVKEQSILRCKILTIVVLAMTINYFFGLGGEFSSIIIISSLFYAASAYLLFYVVIIFPNRANLVSIAGIILDMTIMAILMIAGGSNEAAIYGGYLFLVIGNGLRFGKSYMYFVNLLSVVSFSVVIAFSEFWGAHFFLGIGLMIWLILIPTYLGVLLTRLEDAVEKAETANDAKTMFIANMSHEIRTPLTAIVGFGKTLLDKNIKEEKRIIAVATIIRNGTFLTSIVDDILDISKIEAGKLEVEFRKCSLFEIVQEIEFLFRQKIEDDGKKFTINFEFPLPANINSDSMRIKQILINLCSNAVKFTSLGEISIDISYDQDSKMTQFDVKDTGIGMTDEQLNSVFSSFTQADITTTRKYGGTGLGLTISKRLARMLKGNLWVASTLGKGSTFSFSVMSGDVANEIIAHKAPANKLIESNKYVNKFQVSGEILLVEDVIDNQVLIKMILEDMGASVKIAENGLQAIEYATKKKYDLILMDMQMPVMGGEEAIQKLRAKNYLGPIYVLSANVIRNDMDKFHEIDCQGFLAKPIAEEKLEKVVTQYLKAVENPQSKIESAPQSNEGTNSIENKDAIISTLIKKNSDKYTKIVSRFIAQLKDRIVEIDEAFNSNQYDTLQEYVHKLKGVGGNMGYALITDLSTRIEDLVSKELFDEIPSAISELYIIEARIQKGIKSNQD